VSDLAGTGAPPAQAEPGEARPNHASRRHPTWRHPIWRHPTWRRASRRHPTWRHTSRRRADTFEGLKLTSFGHSCVYLALLVSAFALGKPEPLTFALGLTHGLLWIAMSLACILATRLRIVPLRLAVAVAVLGGIGPFFGSAEFIREQRRRAQGPAR
jgi:hypothetical protein